MWTLWRHGGGYKNARREHFEYVDLPLTHDEAGNVVIDNRLAQVEYLRGLRDALPSADKIIFGNGIRPRRIWAAFHSDVLGVEVSPRSTKAKHYAFYRTVARHKPLVCLWWYDYPRRVQPREAVEEYIKSAVAFGVAPETRPHHLNRQRDLDLFKKYIPILRLVGQAGWEPLTHASSSNTKMWFERFGDGQKGLLFTVFNPTEETAETKLIFDFENLPWAKGKHIRELVTDLELKPAKSMKLRLPPKSLRILQFGEAPDPPTGYNTRWKSIGSQIN